MRLQDAEAKETTSCKYQSHLIIGGGTQGELRPGMGRNLGNGL